MTIKELRDTGWLIYEITAGSKLYNIATESSDDDIRGIYNVPLYKYLCNRHPTKIVSDDEEDAVYMEFITWLELASKGNPNVIDWLYAKNAAEQCKSLEMCEVIDIRESFITKEFLSRSLKMGESMIKRCKTKTDIQWKMLAHAQRLIYMVYIKIHHPDRIYSPKLTGLHRDHVMSLKKGELDYWEEVSRIEQGLQGWYSKIEEQDNIPDEFDQDLKDELILKFKTKYEIESIEQ